MRRRPATRTEWIGPSSSLVYRREGQPQRGARRLEQKFPEDAERLKKTLTGHDRAKVKAALEAAMALYEKMTVGELPAETPLRRQVRAYVADR